MEEITYIDSVTDKDYPVLVDIWEKSVRMTHHFIPEDYIQYLKPLIEHEFFKMVELTCCKDTSGKILGFIGILGDKIEMLFIDPSAQGKGLGKALVLHVIKNFQVKKVDVNEQNHMATGFYLHYGFQVTGRSEVDSMRKPFPLLHLELKDQ